MSDPVAALTRNAALAAAALMTSSTTLVCCVFPAVLATLGAGATLAGLVTAVPQLIWLSEHKPLVFGVTGGLLVVSGLALWYGRAIPCPPDPVAARTCKRLRGVSVVLYGMSIAAFAVGAVCAFVLPILGESTVNVGLYRGARANTPRIR